MTAPTTTAELLAPWFKGAATIPKCRAYRALGIGRDALDELIAAGAIAYVKSGKQQRFRIEQLTAWLDSAAAVGPSVKPGRRGRGKGQPCHSINAAGYGTTNSGAVVYDFKELQARWRAAKLRPSSGER